MTAEEWVGQTIAGKYRVEALLGKGGMGLVLHARHVRLDEQVAIKVLLPAMLEVPGMTTRFLREAQAASKIKSAHVARVSDVDVLPDGTPYMIMEYLDGVSLAALRRQRGPLAIGEAVRFVLEACDAIAEAHSLGIVHRDLKPANLFLARRRDGEEIVKVLDFGISKVDAPGEQDTTKTGQMMGSPKYMAPEQMLSMHDVDGRSDIWSLGAILFDFVAGRPPFVAETTPKLCSMVLHDKPPAPREFRADLPEALEAVILRCLERPRDKRFATVAELQAALLPFAPEGARVPALRAPSSSGVYLPTAWDEAVEVSLPSAPSSADGSTNGSASGSANGARRADPDKSTDVAGPAPSGRTPIPSGTPPSLRGATAFMWSSAQKDGAAAPPGRRRGLALAAGVGTALVLLTAGFLVLRSSSPSSDTPVAGAAAGAALTPRAADVAAPVQPLSQAPGQAPAQPPARATSESSPQAALPAPSSVAPAEGAPGPATGTPGPLPRTGLGHTTKKTSTADMSATDPFGGRRR